MDKPQLSQNTISLLKKGKRGFFRVVFSRTGLMFVLLLVQVFCLFALYNWLESFIPHILGINAVFVVIMVLYLLNASFDPTAKITWLVLIMAVPIFGALLLWYTQSDLGNNALKRRHGQLLTDTRDKIAQDPDVLAGLAAGDPGAASLARYIRRSGCHPVFGRTEVTYFPLGEDMFDELLRQLERAERFIFLEFFIVDEGLMWGRILDVLARKAAAGVDVRLLYDGTCELSLLPRDYPSRLEKLGIRCKAFSKVTPFVSTHYNYRDHRKILVIDGHTAFNGGVNLADEYINHIERFGHWKDTAVMLRGDAAESFTLMFLQMWNITEREAVFDPFLGRPEALPEPDGYVIPYGDSPLDRDKVGEQVYIDLLNRAQRYVHIMTPYLILDGELESALRFAAERGVEVAVILPGIPDKKAPYALAKTHYRRLMESGVQIYEYAPGFVHAKVFVCDGREAVVGTINLDYRSLYHHFECATYLHGCRCIGDIEADFQATKAKCRRATRETLKKEKWTTKLTGILLKAVAPLL